MNHIAAVLAFAAAVTVSTAARADEVAAKRAEAQKAIDDAKIKGCESFKGILIKAKHCPDQSAAAAKVTCSVATAKQMNALYAECNQKVRDKVATARADADAAAAKRAADRVKTCKTTDDAGAVVTELSSASFTGCYKDTKAAVAKAKCAAGIKRVKVMYQYGDGKPTALTVLCPK